MNEGQVVKQEKAQYNTIITLPEFMKKGYSFDGFLYQDKIYKESLTVKENITLVAKYTKLPVYNIIFKNEIGKSTTIMHRPTKTDGIMSFI